MAHLPASALGPTPLQGERRVITSISADIQGSTPLAEQIGLEAWVEVMNRMFQVLSAEVYRYGGEVHQFRGDEVVAFFGARAAHEDDPERAVLATLAMQVAFARYAAQLLEETGIELLLRVGAHTGEVIAATVGDRGRHQEETAMGRTLALADRVQKSAEPGTVLVTESTYRLVAPLFEWQAMGAIAAKGVSRPLPVYRPLAAKTVPGKGRGIPGLVSPLVGRDVELGALREAVERLQAGVGGIVTLVGEAGLGKSRLVAELRGLGLSAGEGTPRLQWLEGRCLSYATGVAYQLWLDALRGRLGVAPDAPPTTAQGALQELVRTLCPDRYDEVYPYLARMMSLPLQEEAEARLRGLDAQSLQHITFRAVETLIECLARERPLVLVCEDLHWADPTSLALLEQMFALTDLLPLLLLCLFRPETEHGCWQAKERAAREYAHRHTDLTLRPLSEGESEALVGNLLYLDALSPGLRKRVLEAGEGNPFFVEEILRSLIDAAADGGAGIAHDEVTGRWVAIREPAALVLPDTLRGVLRARIDRLPAEARHVLQRASVIGRTFSYPVLAAIAEDSPLPGAAGSPLPPGEGPGVRVLENQLVALLRRQMIRERESLPERQYTFKHHLTQEAAYRSLLERERRLVHGRVAQALEQLYPERIEEQLGQLARHWELAGETARAAGYYQRAGAQAAAQYANEEALGYLGRALELTPDTDLAGRCDLLLAREGVYHLQGAREAQWQDLCTLESLAEEMAGQAPSVACERRAEERADQAPSVACKRRAEVAWRRARYALVTADYGAALAAAQEAVRLAEAAQDTENQAAGHLHWGWALVERTDFEAARRQLERGLALAQAASLLPLQAACLRFLGRIAIHQRDPVPAKAHHEQALRIYRLAGDRRGEGILLNNLGVVYRLLLADPVRARDYHEQALDILRQTGDRVEEGWTLVSLGAVCVRLGDYAAARAHLQQALGVFRETGARGAEGAVLHDLGFVGMKVGDFGGAMDGLEESLSIRRDLNDRRREGSVLGVIGLVRMHLGDYAGARDCLKQALEIDLEVGRSGRWLPAYLSRLSQALGEKEAALAYCRQALQHMGGDRRQYAIAWTALGRVLAGFGQPERAADLYRQALTVAREKKLARECPEPLAGLARLALAQGDRAQALQHVDEILRLLEAEFTLEEVYEPSWVVLTCYQVMRAGEDPRAGEMLEAAHRLLQERAAKIDDAALRRSFLENVAANRELVAAWQERS